MPISPPPQPIPSLFRNKVIEHFENRNRWLSNFYSCTIAYDKVDYPTLEHAYQAAKTLNRRERETICLCKTAGKAKRLGCKVTMRPGWDVMKTSVMYELVLQKFERHKDLAAKLLRTKDSMLIEGNDWGDTFWGMVGNKGENHLGKILMRVRGILYARMVFHGF